MIGDGNCFYRAVSTILIDLGLRLAGYRHSDVRADLADYLSAHKSKHMDATGGTIANAAILAAHDWYKPLDLASDEEWPPPSIDKVSFPLHQTLPTHTPTTPP